MNLKTLEADLAKNTNNTLHDLAADLRAETAHFADPAQCGSIVRRHFDGLVFGLCLYVAAVVTIATVVFFVKIF